MESMIPKNEIKLLKAEIAHLSRIINEKGIENVKETKKLKASVPNTQISPTTNDLNRKLEYIDVLRNKTAEILIRPNNRELEMDFRATCSAYQANPSLHDPPLIQAYQDYLNAYEQKTSLYNFTPDSKLMIYNTETETKKLQGWQTLKLLYSVTCITQLPNSKLFCFGSDARRSGITVLIDVNGGVEVFPSGAYNTCYSCIYFNNSVYCFGWYHNKDLNLSSRFDLDQKRYIQLTPMPKADWLCNSIIFNGNILISGYKNRNLLLYSIDIDSFSTIPYEFAADTGKILINPDRLYLIESGGGSIYESEIGSDTNWRKITDSTVWISFGLIYCLYNKGGIYIGESSWGDYGYYKFDLNEKKLILLEQWCVNI